MKRKLIRILIVSTLLITGTFVSVISAKKVDFTSESSGKHIEHFTSDDYDLVATKGPILPFLEVTEIDWIDGDPAKIQEIEQLLDKNFSLKNVGYKTVECSNLSFSITYHWEYRYRPRYKYNFFTTFVNKKRYWLSWVLNAIPYMGIPHTVTIEGFNGDLSVIRQFSPITILNALAEFLFTGEFEKVTIIK